MTIQFKKDIDYQLFEDILVTALEGGVGYWAIIDTDEFYDKLPKETKGEPLSVRIAKEVWNTPDFSINVYDIESDEEDLDLLGALSYANVERGFELLAKDYPEDWDAIMEESYDAFNADTWFQLACLGEVVFG